MYSTYIPTHKHNKYMKLFHYFNGFLAMYVLFLKQFMKYYYGAIGIRENYILLKFTYSPCDFLRF